MKSSHHKKNRKEIKNTFLAAEENHTSYQTPPAYSVGVAIHLAVAALRS